MNKEELNYLTQAEIEQAEAEVLQGEQAATQALEQSRKVERE
jgi:hypothetical protein